MKEISNYLKWIALVGTEVALIRLAFSYETRKEILERDNNTCQSCGITSKKAALEAAHYDHDRNNYYYDEASNGRALCQPCHLQDHIDRAGRNGLSELHNNMAIQSLIQRISKNG